MVISRECRSTVAMQATGVYSIPLDDILTGHGIQVGLVNAQHSKNVPGRNVLSDITGVSGQAIIAAILEGERDPWKLADLKHEMVKASGAIMLPQDRDLASHQEQGFLGEIGTPKYAPIDQMV